MNNREIAYALTRITYGVIFLFYGIGKFMGGISNFVGSMNQQFSGKLPAAMVMPFAYFIPGTGSPDRERKNLCIQSDNKITFVLDES